MGVYAYAHLGDKKHKIERYRSKIHNNNSTIYDIIDWDVLELKYA